MFANIAQAPTVMAKFKLISCPCTFKASIRSCAQVFFCQSRPDFADFFTFFLEKLCGGVTVEVG